jgi:hypothetical protein
MGQLTKTITIEVPPNVTFNAIKEIHSSGWTEKYCKDLTGGGMVMVNALTKEVNNTERVYAGGSWGAKAEEKYTIRSLRDFSEVTVSLSYQLVFGVSVNTWMIDIIAMLLMLEIGYKAKK